jgi:ribosomal-protein-alanine N-acetyltransferase
MRVVREEMREFVSGTLPSEVWELTRDEWQARKGRR